MVAAMMVEAAAASAQKPPMGWSRVMREPIVLTMRQPPNIVPRAMAAWQERMIGMPSECAGKPRCQDPMPRCQDPMPNDHTCQAGIVNCQAGIVNPKRCRSSWPQVEY